MDYEADLAGLQNGSALVYRVGFELGSVLESKESENRVFANVTLVDEAIKNWSAVWSSKGGGRYSDGSWKVLYTAMEPKTSLIEKGYWVYHTVLEPVSKDKSVELTLYTLVLSGDGESVFDDDGTYDKEFVHPSDYSFCHLFAKRAMARGVDFLLVPSARCESGKCVPVFRMAASTVVKSDEDISVVRIIHSPSTGQLKAELHGTEFPLVFSEVYDGK